MPLNLFYTMVQKRQRWPKTQIKGGPALSRGFIHDFTLLFGRHLRIDSHWLWIFRIGLKTWQDWVNVLLKNLPIASPRVPPPPPLRRLRGIVLLCLPGGGEFDLDVGYGGGAHWPTSVCTVIFACAPGRFNGPSRANIPDVPCGGYGGLTITSVPGWGFRIHFAHTLVKSPRSPGRGGGVPLTCNWQVLCVRTGWRLSLTVISR